MKIAITIIIIIMCFGCNNDDKLTAYEEQKKQLVINEVESPLSFLQVSWERKKNLIGQTVVTCTIKNNAALTTYEEIRLKMECLHENIRIEEHEDVIKDALPPKDSITVKLKYRLPKETDRVQVSVMSASAVDKKEN